MFRQSCWYFHFNIKAYLQPLRISQLEKHTGTQNLETRRHLCIEDADDNMRNHVTLLHHGVTDSQTVEGFTHIRAECYHTE